MKTQPIDTSHLSPAMRQMAVRAEHSLRKSCEGFESVVLKQLLESGSSGDFFGTGTGSSMVRALHTTHLADAVVEGGGIGISTMLFASLREGLAREIAQEEARQLAETGDTASAANATGDQPS